MLRVEDHCNVKELSKPSSRTEAVRGGENGTRRLGRRSIRWRDLGGRSAGGEEFWFPEARIERAVKAIVK